MLRLDRSQKRFSRLETRRLPDEGILERTDIQQLILNSPSEFFEELGEKLLLVGQEVRPAEFVDDRVDLLAVDTEGHAVVIELKRGNHKLHLLQALSYAGMVSKWEPDRFIQERMRLAAKTQAEAEEEIEQFLDTDATALNQAQRVILIAEDFDFQVLITAEWLSEAYSVDIRCYRMTLSVDGETQYVSCTGIYPPPELTQYAVRGSRGVRPPRPVKWPDWDAALAGIENAAVADFYRRELDQGTQNRLRGRVLRYYVKGRRRYWMGARRNHAYVWQTARFDGDVDFWRKTLGEQCRVEPVKGGECLRFYLSSSTDFERFKKALSQEIANVEFLDADAYGESEAEAES